MRAETWGHGRRVFELDHDGRGARFATPVDQLLRLRQLQLDRDLVEFLEALVFGGQHLERRDVGRPAGLRGQQFDGHAAGHRSGLARGGRRAFRLCQRRNVAGQRPGLARQRVCRPTRWAGGNS
jgi:hypothetical protein